MGWREPERLNTEALHVIEGIDFADSDTMEVILCHSPKLVARVKAVLLEKERDFN